MKGKISTKTIIISIITIVLLTVAVTGTVLFLKDSGEATTAEKQQNDVLLPVASSDSQIETNTDQGNNNQEIKTETSTGTNKTENGERTIDQSQETTITTPSQATATIKEEPETTTVQREKIIAEETTLGWNNLSVSSLDTDYTGKNINYNNLKYIVEYYFDEEIDETLTDIISGNPEGKIIDTYTNKDKNGYILDITKGENGAIGLPLKISKNLSENIIKVYYKKRTDLSYTVYYKEEGTDKDLTDAKVVEGQTYGAKVTEEAIEIDGYGKLTPTSKEIEITTGTNEATFYYKGVIKYPFTVYYYYDGEIDSTKTTNGTALEGTIITLVEKPKEGYTKYDQSKDTEIKASKTENIFKVYYGKPNVSIVKSAPTEVSYGESIHYEIKITNSGYLGTTVTVTDELKGTLYKEDTAKPEYKNKTTSDTSGNTILTWEIEIPGATDNGNAVENIEFDINIPTDATIGTIYKNTATSRTTQEQTSSSETETKIKEFDVKFDEWREGKEGKDLNIIFLIDNSSSMNEPTANNTYENNSATAVAPSDRTKTRIESAKSAIKSFITSDSNDTMTVIKYNNSRASENAEVINLSGTGYPVSELKFENNDYNHPDDGPYSNGPEGKNYYYETDIDGSKLKLYSRNNYVGEINGKKYILATDGKCYEYTKAETAQGTQVVGTTISGKTGATNNSGLNSAVSSMTIGDLRSSFGTYVSPAFSKAADYIVKEKTNVVIVLSDGAFNDRAYKNAAESLIESGADYIYSVAFGANADKNKLKAITNVYEKDKDGNDTENKKVYEASDASTLLNEFRAIKASASGKEQNKTTEKGKVTFDPASNTIQVKEKCPIIAYITGTTKKLFESYDIDELKSKYGIEIASDGKTLTWDSNTFIANNQDEVSDIIKGNNQITIQYYIKSSN